MTSLRTHNWGDPDRPALLLVHGLTEAGTAWPHAVERWSPTWHVHAVDLRGHGGSPRFDTAAASRMLDTFVNDLVETLRALGPATVIGHSLGGRVAAIAATRAPDLVRALVLEDPALTQGTVTPPGFADEQHTFLDRFDNPADAGREKVLMRRNTTWTDDEIDRWAECKPHVDRHMIDQLELGQVNASDVFTELRCPTLVLYDADGPFAKHSVPTSNPSVDVRYLDGVSHCIRRDDPTTYHAIVDPWLANHGR